MKHCISQNRAAYCNETAPAIKPGLSSQPSGPLPGHQGPFNQRNIYAFRSFCAPTSCASDAREYDYLIKTVPAYDACHRCANIIPEVAVSERQRSTAAQRQAKTPIRGRLPNFLRDLQREREVRFVPIAQADMRSHLIHRPRGGYHSTAGRSCAVPFN
jgi:hypothetical protein